VLPAAEHSAQYFARYAEPEAALAAPIDGEYAAAIVVPLCRESPAFFAGYEAARRVFPGRTLLVLVVNGAEGASPETHAENQLLLAALSERFSDRRELSAPDVASRAWLARESLGDVLWLDRASSGVRLPRGEGVGLARKLGADIAVRLWARGRITCSQIACSDADATLPSDYFARLVRAATLQPASPALLWPFQHVSGGDPALDEATLLYEISLRYYVLGLAAAGSPYAYQSVGSSLCVDARAYVSVRGFPKRAAAEDFYLLDKLAKLGPLRRLSGAPLELRARFSDRVPFGTGRGTREIAELERPRAQFKLYSPALFAALRTVLAGLEAFASSRAPGALRNAVEVSSSELVEPTVAALETLKVFAALESAAREAPAGPVLRRRVHTWFDALRTLRFMHLLRDASAPSLPWRDALGQAPFLSEPFRDGDGPAAVLARLRSAESDLPELVGPTR
jgi:hypothetical protein